MSEQVAELHAVEVEFCHDGICWVTQNEDEIVDAMVEYVLHGPHHTIVFDLGSIDVHEGAHRVKQKEAEVREFSLHALNFVRDSLAFKHS